MCALALCCMCPKFHVSSKLGHGRAAAWRVSCKEAAIPCLSGASCQCTLCCIRHDRFTSAIWGLDLITDLDLDLRGWRRSSPGRRGRGQPVGKALLGVVSL